jgi:hypothetical protein
MTDRRLSRELERVALRYRRLHLRASLALLWLALAAAAGAAWWLGSRSGGAPPWAVPALAALAAPAALACWLAARRSARDHRRLAEEIEARHPDLDARLLAAVEQEPRLSGGRFGFLQERLLREVLAHSRREPWGRAVSDRSLALARLANLAALALFCVSLAALHRLPAGGAINPSAGTEAPRTPAPSALTVEPGDTEIERGASLLVLARWSGEAPEGATLVTAAAAPAAVGAAPGDAAPGDAAAGGGSEASLVEERTAMSRSLDDPVFGARLSRVDRDLVYRVEHQGGASPSYRVRVFEHPELVRADARLVFPEYTGKEAAVIEDTRRVSAVEGTELTWVLHVTKPVAEARLESLEPAAEDGGNLAAIDLPPGEAPTILLARLLLARSGRYSLLLADADGRRNKEPVELAVNVLPNRPPDLKLVQPSRDARVSPLEELSVRAEAWDDFGLRGVGLSYSLAGREPRDLILAEEVPARVRRAAEHLIDFEALAAQPDELVSYYFWAEDAGPDGGARRAYSDMYFAEVRPFEEIFRRGADPAGGEAAERERERREREEAAAGGEGAQAAEDLAELEKQIVTGTWNLIRRETGPGPSASFAADAGVLEESQRSALEQALAMSALFEDPESRAHLEEVLRHMEDAADELARATAAPDIEPLRPALGAEQSAYQGLLRLRARQHEVVRGRRSEGQEGRQGSSAASRSQAALDQLELEGSENRYETERQASPRAAAEDPAARETRQALNRLGELARRQGDLNRRLKELQSALEEAASEEEREEIRRELKRLRDEEREVLRDTDELRERMDRPENQERMAESRESLERTRENVRRASEALEEGQVSQAAAAGTRAEREFEELREEFRRQASGRFGEAMREMRDDARRLDAEEGEIARRLDGLEGAESRTLRGPGGRAEIEEALERQRGELGGLLERMEKTIREAEEPEPLLANELYDALRTARQEKLEDSLEVTRELLERGFVGEAEAAETRVREGIGDLRRGVEEAAEKVLGDGTEALRRAAGELDQLSRDLDEEIARATGERGGEPQAGEAQPGERQGGERAAEAGEAQAGERQGGERQGGEPQAGERQGGERQGGEPQAGERQGGERQGGEPQAGEPQAGEPQAGRGEAQGGEPQPGRGEPQAGERQGGERPAADRPGARDDAGRGGGAFEEWAGGRRAVAPLTGDDYREWSDRLRDVEEMIDDPELRSEAARVRDRARGVRSDLKRHAKEPNWDLVRETIAGPLVELQKRVAEELLRRESKDARVPLDRDPVPSRYEEDVRRYYERLGSGK